MMISQLTYNDRQEWIIRVGCLIIVVGVYLWLLLISPLDFLLSGKMAYKYEAISEHASSTLLVSFSEPKNKQQKQRELLSKKNNKTIPKRQQND